MSRRHRNSDHPEGAPDPLDEDQPVWPPHEAPAAEPEGETLSEKLNSALSFLNHVPGLEARVRAALLSEGLPELYAECVASDVAEGWANGDPAPIYMMPGYVPPQDDADTVASSPQLKASVDAWHEKWEEERRGDEKRRATNPPRWSLVSIEESSIHDKKFVAVFRDNSTGRQKTVHFGASGYEDYTTHRDDRRKQLYLERHGRGRENWNDPTTPGALSRWILWNKPTLKASIADFKRRFGL